jgi:hypothetical protein
MTVRDLITGSLRLIGASSQGEAASASEMSESLFALNDMIESWSTEGFTVFNTVKQSFPLVPGQSKYLIGLDVSNDFVTEIPLIIENASVLTNGSEMYLRTVESKEYSEIVNKDIQSAYPSILYFNRNAPSSEIILWPVPNEAKDLILYSQKKLGSFSSINDTIQMPPGYTKALRYNLAVELAPEYGKEPSNTVISQALESKTIISRINNSPQFMVSDAVNLMSSSRPFNIYKGF